MEINFAKVDCSTESGLAQAIQRGQAHQMQKKPSNVYATSAQDECVDTCECDICTG